MVLELDSDNNDGNSSDEPKIISKEINLAGDRDNCGVCKESDEFFSTKAIEAGTKYSYHPMGTDEGKRIASNVETKKGEVPIPVVEYCKTVKESDDDEPEKICDYMTGFNKNDWDSELNYKRRNEVDDELNDIFGDD